MRWLFAYILIVVTAASARGAIEVTLVGRDIPARYVTGVPQIFFESDTVSLNHRQLVRSRDYEVDYGRGIFDFSSLTIDSTDTLHLIYAPGPSWLKRSYGRVPPPIEPGESTPSGGEITPSLTMAPPRAGGVAISGAKSFRFSSRNSGSSAFSQSLDLSLSGELTRGLTVTGSVSDRGYDPAYGTANSRLNELNKISLELESQRFEARVGDLSLDSRGGLLVSRTRRVSGAWVRVHDPTWHVEAAAARPKGLFETARFYCTDGVQGPYQIGSRTAAIVPGSEQVWLDGRQLLRGTNEAYTMDYPAGTITFNVGFPIDSRSRVEIDYEPQSTAYRAELFSGGGGVALADSALTFEVGWMREGDDKGQPLTGELTESDKQILAAAGDSMLDAIRSGVRPDTAGHYVLLADSLPDTVYQYVAPDTGDYAITFSYVGPENGAYRNLGDGRYEFIGVGAGDYLPIVILTAPSLTDYYVARTTLRSAAVGSLRAEIRRSRLDRNLFSPLDDSDNDGNLYLLTLNRPWQTAGETGGLNLSTRRREITFKPRERLYDADFNRQFYLPLNFVPSSDEWLHRADLTLSPLRTVTVRTNGSLLSYRDNTESRTGGLSVSVTPLRRLEVTAGWQGIHSDLADSSRSGTTNTYNAGATWALSRQWDLRSAYESDRRTNRFSGAPGGTRYQRLEAVIDHRTEQVRLERYVEDSLAAGWNEALNRTRLELRSNRRLGPLSYTSTLVQQWLTRPEGDENSFIGRLNLQYTDLRRRWNATGSYLLSEETRYSRGLVFLEVEPGQGSFSLEDGRYVPDPNGNYVQVEEILSDRAKVSRGEKTFYFSKDWSLAVVRFNSRIEEDLLDNGTRSALWALPFYSDPDQPYQYYNTRYDIDLRLIPIRNAHAVNVTANQNREIRTVAGSNRDRRDRRGSVTFKQVIQNSYFDESVELFESKRDAYYPGTGNIDGYSLGLSWRQQIGPSEISSGGGYREASAATGEKSEQYQLRAGSRVAVISRGELRTAVELYRQSLTDFGGSVSYVLTDNRPGKYGAIWSLELRYGVKKNLRINASLGGRHSDNRTARVTARGEMVAEF